MTTKTHTLLSNIAKSVLFKGTSYFLYALSIPLYIAYFKHDDVKTGVWFIIISTCTWLLALDMGVGNGLRNRLVLLLHRGSRRAITHAILATYLINCLLAVVLVGASAVIIETIKHTNQDLALTQRAIYIVVLAVGFHFILRTITFILYAEQNSGLIGVFNLVTNASMCLFLTFAELGVRDSMDVLAWAYFIALNGPILVFSLWRLCWSRGIVSYYVKRSPRLVLLNATKIGKSGADFFSNQLLYLLIIQTTPILIGSLISPAAVVQYTTYSTIFLALVIVANIVSAPLWSLITKAQHEGDTVWIGTAMARFVALGGLFALIQAAIYFAFPQIIELWFNGRAIFSDVLANRTAFVVFSTTLIFHSVASTFACGVSELRMQRRFYLVAIAFKGLVCAYINSTGSDFWGLLLLADAAILAGYSILELATSLRAPERRPASAQPGA